jgi:hypothetical protein
MRIVAGIILMIGGLCGAVIGFLGTVVVNSQLEILDGLEFSTVLAGFSISVGYTYCLRQIEDLTPDSN